MTQSWFGAWRWRSLTLAILIATSPTAAWAQYRVEQFTTSNGLPQNTISGIGQTRDGYLWIATYDGLVRYDGVTFTIFDRGTTPEMLQTQFLNLFIDGAGSLWAGTTSGVLRFQNGAFTWLAPLKTPESARHPADAHYRSDFIPPTPRWSWDSAGLYRSGPDSARHYTPPAGVPRVVFRVAGEDREGYIWLNSPQWLLRFRDGVFTAYNSDSLVGSKSIRSALVDREGTVWIGTNEKGLFRLTRQFLNTYSVEEGLFTRIVYPVLQDHTGAIWMGVGHDLVRLERGRLTTNAVVQDASGHVHLVPVASPAADLAVTATAKSEFAIRSLFEDRAGHLWVGLAGRAIVVENGRVARTVDGLDGFVEAMFEDRAGDLWFGTPKHIIRLRGDSLRVFGPDDGLPKPTTNSPTVVYVFYEDSRGTLWVGTRHGLVHREGDRFIIAKIPSEGAGENVRSLYADTAGTLWIGTFDNGLVRLKGGRFTSITTRDGLFSNGAFQILEDAHDQFWISSNRGIYRVSRRQLNDFADGRTTTVSSVAYGARDGMRSVEANGGRQPAGIRARDGTLWFPTQDGVIAIDPSAVVYDAPPPLVVFDHLMVDGTPLPVASTVRLSPGQSDLEIGYTAPSSVHADDIHFRYRLIGLNDSWIEAGLGRQVHYSHLAPGRYAFEVIAAHGDGGWSKTGTQLNVEVDPHLYQTTSFLIACALTITGLAATGYTLRVRGLKAQERRLTGLVNERTADLQMANERLHQLSIEDGLTGLANHRRFDEFLAQEWQRSRRTKTELSVLLVDVDHFKLYNDTRGHPAGDQCLRQVAATIGSMVRRGTDLAARYGGEEFAIVLTDTPVQNVPLVAETLRTRIEALAIPHGASPVALHVTISIGVATRVAGDNATFAELVEAADRALYRAKSRGRNRVENQA